jgi:23S rRNA pseudouridine2605 synthase
MPQTRLQKILADAGVASRRKAEEYIQEGRVTVNGEIVTALGSKADPQQDHIKVDGRLIRMPSAHVYLALNKPREVVTTVSDPQGRKTVIHLLKGVKARVFPVGRLDYHSEGLLLLTNDGDWANAILSPRNHVEKVYLAKVTGRLKSEQLEQFKSGVSLSGRRTAPARIKLIKEGNNPWYEVTLTEGRQHQVRLMFKNFGLLVEKLRRVRIGPLKLQGLPPGEFRALTALEVEKLQKAGQAEKPPAPRPARAASKKP